MRDASALLADMLGLSWDGVGIVETYMMDQELWLPTCNYENLAATGTVQCYDL